jgi:hypothetical protein
MSDDVFDDLFERAKRANLDRLRATGLDVDNIDLNRLHELIRQSCGAHPDRDEIIAMMQQGMTFFVTPKGDELELLIGYHDDPALNQQGATPGWTTPLGTLALADIVRSPQG